VNDREQLPDFLLSDPITAAISEALHLVGIRALEAVASAEAQFSPATATWGMDQWERILGISPKQGMTLEQRRQAVMSKFSGKRLATKEAVEDLIHTITGHQTMITEQFAKYQLELSFLGDEPGFLEMDAEALYESVKNVLPAHLQICLKPVTWQSIEQAAMTWSKLEQTFSTWGALEASSPITVKST